MPDKIITFRADEDDLERIEQLKTKLEEMNHIKISTSDVIKSAIVYRWLKLCLPYKDENNKTTG